MWWIILYGFVGFLFYVIAGLLSCIAMDDLNIVRDAFDSGSGVFWGTLLWPVLWLVYFIRQICVGIVKFVKFMFTLRVSSFKAKTNPFKIISSIIRG